MTDIELDNCDSLSPFSAPFVIGWLAIGVVLLFAKFSDEILHAVANPVIQPFIFSAVGAICITGHLIRRGVI